jgi:hypothetical protein
MNSRGEPFGRISASQLWKKNRPGINSWRPRGPASSRPRIRSPHERSDIRGRVFPHIAALMRATGRLRCKQIASMNLGAKRIIAQRLYWRSVVSKLMFAIVSGMLLASVAQAHAKTYCQNSSGRPPCTGTIVRGGHEYLCGCLYGCNNPDNWDCANWDHVRPVLRSSEPHRALVKKLARMSAAISGFALPAYRCAHAGHLLLAC